MNISTQAGAHREATVRVSRKHWYALIIITVAILICPFAMSLIKLPPVAVGENRVLASRPPLPKTFREWKKFPSKVDPYVQDNFPLRMYWIAYSNELRYLLGYSTTERVTVGKDGWLFYYMGDTVGFWHGRRRSQAQLDAWMQDFRHRIQETKDLGIPFYVIYPPYKETVYSDKLPSWALPIDRRSEVDQLLDATRKEHYDQIVDVRSELREAAKSPSRRVYFKYDTHWNSEGAFIGYTKLLERIRRDRPDLAPTPKEQFPLQERPIGMRNYDLAYMLGIGSFVDLNEWQRGNLVKESQITYITSQHVWSAPHIITSDQKKDKTLLFVSDSFGGLMMPFLLSNFGRVIYAANSDGFFREDLIRQFHPDIIVLEVIEPYAAVSF